MTSIPIWLGTVFAIAPKMAMEAIREVDFILKDFVGWEYCERISFVWCGVRV
jgi:hypothetical protein